MTDQFMCAFDRLDEMSAEQLISALLKLKRHKPSASLDAFVPKRNLTDSQLASFRAKLVNQIWESDLRADLVDRIVFAYDGGYFDVPTLRSAIRRAKSRKADYERSNGLKGKDAIWKTLASWLKGVYESHGVEWTPTASALEPRPEAPAALDEDEILARDAEIRRTRYRNGVILNCEAEE